MFNPEFFSRIAGTTALPPLKLKADGAPDRSVRVNVPPLDTVPPLRLKVTLARLTAPLTCSVPALCVKVWLPAAMVKVVPEAMVKLAALLVTPPTLANVVLVLRETVPLLIRSPVKVRPPPLPALTARLPPGTTVRVLPGAKVRLEV